MKIEHIAVASNSEYESDRFFIDLLELKKIRKFAVNENLMEKFFGIRKEQEIIRYSNEEINIEVFILNDNTTAKDIFTHSCLIIEHRNKLISRAKSMGYSVIKVQRENSTNFYLFIKDSFGNLFEIKSP
ncbi:MAG: VOC family protein [Candidatus Hodarchaeota archaeon]